MSVRHACEKLDAIAALGCGDNACIFGKRRGIMTDGRCRCLIGCDAEESDALTRAAMLIRYWAAKDAV